MSKRLPYFQFEPAEWLAGDIMFCSLAAQGLFTTLKALYWQKDCDLLLEQAMKRLKNEDLFQELISEKIIKIKSNKIRINFLDEQWERLSEKSKINSKNGALGGRPKKQIETENKPNGYDSLSENKTETKALRREEIREEDNNKKEKEEENKEKEILFEKESKKNKPFLFKKNLLDYGFDENLVDDWLKVRKTKKATNTETAFKAFIIEIESKQCDINEMLQIAVTNSWSGFKHKWVDNLKNSQNGKSSSSNSSTTNDEHKQSAVSAVNALFGVK